MWCLGRKVRRDVATQTDITYVHVMRLVEYDTGADINAHPRVVQRDRESRKSSESKRTRGGDPGHLPAAQSNDLCEYIRVGPFDDVPP